MAIPTRLQTLLDEGRIVIRSAIGVQLGSGWYGICSGKYELSATIDGFARTFLPNAVVEVEEAPNAIGNAAAPLKVKVPARLDFGITPDKLRTIESEVYKNKPCYFYDLYIDPDTRAVIHVLPRFDGYIDTIDHVESDTDFYLQFNAETSALDNFRNGYRTASDEDQQLLSAGDRFFQYAGTVDKEYFDITLT